MPSSQELLDEGWLCQCRGDFVQAERFYREVIQADPNHSRAWRLLADLCASQQRFAESIPLYQQAVRLEPQHGVAYFNLGNTFLALGRLAEAEASYRQAIERLPDIAEAHNNLGITLGRQGRHDEAAASYRRTLRLQPDCAAALVNLAEIDKSQGRLDEAIARYRHCLALQPTNNYWHSNYVYALQYHPAYSPQTVFEEHLKWARQHALPIAAAAPIPADPHPERRLRIGYVSADFRLHVMGTYSEAVCRAHDRERFEIFCYSNTPTADGLTRQIQALVHWKPVNGLSDAQAAALIRQDQIDILVDFSGHSGGNRLLIFAHKPAPIQITHFGYPATTGMSTVDYRFTDAYAEPPGMTERYCTEELLRLPDLLWCYPPPVSPEVGPLPAGQAGHVTFGSFNSPTKINDRVIAAWGRILTRVPTARMAVLTGQGRETDERLLDAFALAGVAAGRVTFLAKTARAAYFDLYRGVDVCLDSFPYSGCNTTADTLWMGVPVVSLAGETCSARSSVGPLAVVGLGELAVSTPEAYVDTAVKLAGDVSRLSELRKSLRERMRQSPLTDVPRFTRQLEEAYRTVWRRAVARHG